MNELQDALFALSPQVRYVAVLRGKDLSLRVDGGKVMVDNATVVKADVEASNGVIHVIDTVLMP